MAGVTRRFGWLETLAWFGLYAGLIGFVLFADGSAPMYRQIFIDRTATHWLPDATRDYEPGTTISGTEPSAFFAGGWWWATPDGIWGKGERNVVEVVPRRAVPAGGRVTGTLRALIGGLRQSQAVSVSVAGVEIGRLQFEDGSTKEFSFSLPMTLPAGERAEIVFHVPGAQSPLLLHIDGNTRQLGIQLLRLVVGAP